MKKYIKFKKNQDQVELIRAMGSKKVAESLAALEIFAAAISKTIGEVVDQADVTSQFYTTEVFSEGQSQVIDIDPYYLKTAGEIKVWQQNIAGGLGSSLIAGGETVPFTYYTLYSAISWLKQLLREGRVNYVAKGINRMIQEILVQQNLNRIVPVLNSVATASTNNLTHVVAGTTAGIFQVDDLNNMMIRMKRIWASWAGGTGVGTEGNALTDMYGSPEWMGQIRGFSYQPQNTRAVPNTDESTAVPLDDITRSKIMSGAGLPELFNVTLHEVNELGLNGTWSVLFDAAYTGSYDPTTQEVVLGFDLSQENYIRPVKADEDSTFTTLPDDQFVARQEKAGLYGSVTEGAITVDPRGCIALIY